MTIQTPNDESDADRTSTLENKGEGGLTKAKTKEYLRDWPAAGELSDALMEQLERLAQDLLVHGVGLSLVDFRAREGTDGVYDALSGLSRYTAHGVRVLHRFPVLVGLGEEFTIEDAERFVDQMYARSFPGNLLSLDELSLRSGDTWAPWPEDGDARVGDFEKDRDSSVVRLDFGRVRVEDEAGA